MRQSWKLAAIMVTCAALSTSAFGQGRHDEKPHGSKKESKPSASAQSRTPATGGRHDEGPTTHGTRKPVPKDSQDGAKEPKGK